MAELKWEEIHNDLGFIVRRTRIFGGWLVTTTDDVLTPEFQGYETPVNVRNYEWRTSITFVPDPNHEWKIY